MVKKELTFPSFLISWDDTGSCLEYIDRAMIRAPSWVSQREKFPDKLLFHGKNCSISLYPERSYFPLRNG